MWGAGWAFVLIIGTIVTILMAGQDKNSRKIDANTNRIVQHEKVMNESIHSVEQALTVISINQKRQMEDVGLKYLDPERVKTYYYDKEN